MATAYKLPDLSPAPRLPIEPGSLAGTFAAAKPTLITVAKPFNELLAEYHAAGEAIGQFVPNSPQWEAGQPMMRAAGAALFERRPISFADFEDKLRALNAGGLLDEGDIAPMLIEDVRHLASLAATTHEADVAVARFWEHVAAFRTYCAVPSFDMTGDDEAAYAAVSQTEKALFAAPATSPAGVAGKLRCMLRLAIGRGWSDDLLLDPTSDRLCAALASHPVEHHRQLWDAIRALETLSPGCGSNTPIQERADEAVWGKYAAALQAYNDCAWESPENDAREQRYLAASLALFEAPVSTPQGGINKLRSALISNSNEQWVQDAVLRGDMAALIAGRDKLQSTARLLVDALVALWRPTPSVGYDPLLGNAAGARTDDIARVSAAAEALVRAAREHLTPAFFALFLKWARTEAVAWTKGGTDDEAAMEERMGLVSTFASTATSNPHELALKVYAISMEALDEAYLGAFPTTPPSSAVGPVYTIDRLGYSLLHDIGHLSPLPDLIDVLGRCALEASVSTSAWCPEVGAAIIGVFDKALPRPTMGLSASFSAALANYKAARANELKAPAGIAEEEDRLAAACDRTTVALKRLAEAGSDSPEEAAELLVALDEIYDLGAGGCDRHMLRTALGQVVNFVRQDRAA